MAERTRVAVVIGELGKGGAEYQTHELLRFIDRTRFDPRVFVLTEGGYWADRIRALDIPVVAFPARRSADVARLRALRKALREFRPQILHTVLWSANSYGRLAALGLGIPVVVVAERNVIRRPGWQVSFERLLDRWTDHYLVNSQAIVEEMTGHGGLRRDKIEVVWNGVDLARLPAFALDRRAARAALGFDPTRRLVAQVGRLTAQKDYPTYLAVAAALCRTHDDVDFLCVGQGELQADLEAQARALGLADRVRFTGVRHDVPAILGACDVMALTSLWEGLPNVVIEACAMGAVTVATDVGGCREVIVPDATGLIVRPKDVEGITAAVRRVLDDGPLAMRLATAARRRIEDEFSVQAMAARTMARYDALLARRGMRATMAAAA